MTRTYPGPMTRNRRLALETLARAHPEMCRIGPAVHRDDTCISYREADWLIAMGYAAGLPLGPTPMMIRLTSKGRELATNLGMTND